MADYVEFGVRDVISFLFIERCLTFRSNWILIIKGITRESDTRSSFSLFEAGCVTEMLQAFVVCWLCMGD